MGEKDKIIAVPHVDAAARGALAERMRSVHVSRIREMPRIELYLDQLITLVSQELEFMKVPGETPVTGSMVNNYVKEGLMTPVKGKKYTRQQIMQLLCVAIPKLEELNKQGEEGRKKIAQITRYVTVGLGFVQAVALTAGLGASTQGALGLITIGFCLAAGTALAMWIGERITEKGLGNGISLLIFAGIISNLFTGFTTLIRNAFQATSLTPWLTLLAVLLVALVMIVLVTFVDMGVRRINVHFAKRVSGRKMYGGQNSVIPMKVVSVGVLPLIFAYSFMAFPGTIIQLVGGSDSAAAIWWARYMNGASFWYLLVTALLIIAFTYFYSSISFQPDEMAKNIQQQGGAVPSVRPGKPTADYLRRINGRLTLFAALFLAILATVPTVFTVGLQTQIPFAASSILIAVSVVLETKRQLDDLLVSRNYDSIS